MRRGESIQSSVHLYPLQGNVTGPATHPSFVLQAAPWRGQERTHTYHGYTTQVLLFIAGHHPSCLVIPQEGRVHDRASSCRRPVEHKHSASGLLEDHVVVRHGIWPSLPDEVADLASAQPDGGQLDGERRLHLHPEVSYRRQLAGPGLEPHRPRRQVRPQGAGPVP